MIIGTCFANKLKETMNLFLAIDPNSSEARSSVFILRNDSIGSPSKKGKDKLKTRTQGSNGRYSGRNALDVVYD